MGTSMRYANDSLRRSASSNGFDSPNKGLGLAVAFW